MPRFADDLDDRGRNVESHLGHTGASVPVGPDVPDQQPAAEPGRSVGDRLANRGLQRIRPDGKVAISAVLVQEMQNALQ